MEDILLVGLGGHAHSVADSIEQGGKYNIIGFLDKEEMLGKRFRDYRVLGTDDAMERYYADGVRNAFVTIGFLGYGSVRERLYNRLKEAGYTLPDIIDGTAVVSDHVKLAEGIFVGRKAVLNAGAEIGKMSIINTGAIVEHDCMVGAFTHIAVGSVLCGGVSVGSRTLVGANAVVIQERRIGNHCIVGAGSVVRKDMEDNRMMLGNEIVKNLRGGGIS